MFTWKIIPSRTLANLHVLSKDGMEIGFIQKPRDTQTDKNAWRAFNGIGERANFTGHAWSIERAKALVEAHVK